jgi:similar to spore coat protein
MERLHAEREVITVAQGIPLHQTLELHELMTFKNACAAKAALMSGLAQD